MVKVQIQCPACKEQGFVEVRENIVSGSEKGITAINVAAHLVCKHSFIAYIDRNFVVRDCFVTDFTIQTPEIEMVDSTETFLKDTSKNIDMYLISLNVSAQSFIFLLRACFNKKKVLIINDLDVVIDQMKNLVDKLVEPQY